MTQECLTKSLKADKFARVLVIGMTDGKFLTLRGDIAMAEFYIEKKTNDTGEHIVHSSTCSSLPTNDTMQYLGAYSNVNAPVNKAQYWFSKVSTCPKCLAA